jgi:filamentous hemagglutinin
LISPLGGHQGADGRIGTETFYFEYTPHSFLDKLVESFAGTHDTLNSFIWYDELGNGKKLEGLTKILGDVANGTNVPLATPFALSVLLPPEVWNAVLAALKGGKP